MLIVSGKLYLRPGSAERFLEASLEAVKLARQTSGCHDFIVAADPLETDRVNVYEEWESEEALLAFRGDGPGNEMQANIVSASVHRHTISSTGPA